MLENNVKQFYRQTRKRKFQFEKLATESEIPEFGIKSLQIQHLKVIKLPLATVALGIMSKITT